MNCLYYFKSKRDLVEKIDEQSLHIEHLKRRLQIYEKRDEDIRALTRDNENLNAKVIELNDKVLKLQDDKIIDLQNQREFEEANERLEELVEVYKDIIKGSKTITTARKKADKLKEVE